MDAVVPLVLSYCTVCADDELAHSCAGRLVYCVRSRIRNCRVPRRCTVCAIEAVITFELQYQGASASYFVVDDSCSPPARSALDVYLSKHAAFELGVPDASLSFA